MLGTSDLAVAAAAASVPGIKLNDGNVIPQIGLGLLRIENDDVAPVVKSALAAGYRHIDGAAGYNNEGGVGRALAETGFNKGRKRSHLWVTTKLRDSEQGYDMALAAFDRQLGLLQLEYVDMYMIHWPTPFNWRSGATWKAFTKLRDEGRVKTLGVCNFLPEHLTRYPHEFSGGQRQRIAVDIQLNFALFKAGQFSFHDELVIFFSNVRFEAADGFFAEKAVIKIRKWI